MFNRGAKLQTWSQTMLDQVAEAQTLFVTLFDQVAQAQTWSETMLIILLCDHHFARLSG